MSWIKIEFQRDMTKEGTKRQVEKIDYERIREITHEVVMEEIKEHATSQPVPLTREDIQEAVCNAIVKAKEMSVQKEAMNQEKIGFWKSIVATIIGKRQGDGDYTARFLAVIMSAGLSLLAVLGAMIVVIGIVVLIQTGMKMEWNEMSFSTNLAVILGVLGFLVIVAIYAIIFRGAANDIKYEKDRNYIVAIFSGYVSLVALIVSVIALYRG